MASRFRSWSACRPTAPSAANKLPTTLMLPPAPTETDRPLMSLGLAVSSTVVLVMSVTCLLNHLRLISKKSSKLRSVAWCRGTDRVQFQAPLMACFSNSSKPATSAHARRTTLSRRSSRGMAAGARYAPKGAFIRGWSNSGGKPRPSRSRKR